MPDGIAVCIHDFGVVHYAGHAIGVRNIFGGVKVVHRAVQRGIAVSLPAGKGCAVGGSAGNNKSAVTQRDNHAGGALYDIILAEVQIAEAQPAILDFSAGYKVVFFQNG